MSDLENRLRQLEIRLDRSVRRLAAENRALRARVIVARIRALGACGLRFAKMGGGYRTIAIADLVKRVPSAPDGELDEIEIALDRAEAGAGS